MKNIYIKIIGYLCATFMALPLFGMELVKPVITGTFSINTSEHWYLAPAVYHELNFGIKDTTKISVPIVSVSLSIKQGNDIFLPYDKNYKGVEADTLKKHTIDGLLLNNLIKDNQFIQDNDTVIQDYPGFILQLTAHDTSIGTSLCNGLKHFKESPRFVDSDRARKVTGNQTAFLSQKGELTKADVVKKEIINGQESYCHGEESYLEQLGLLKGKILFSHIDLDKDEKKAFVKLIKVDGSSETVGYPLSDFTQWVNDDSVGKNINGDGKDYYRVPEGPYFNQRFNKDLKESDVNGYGVGKILEEIILETDTSVYTDSVPHEELSVEDKLMIENLKKWAQAGEASDFKGCYVELDKDSMYFKEASYPFVRPLVKVILVAPVESSEREADLFINTLNNNFTKYKNNSIDVSVKYFLPKEFRDEYTQQYEEFLKERNKKMVGWVKFKAINSENDTVSINFINNKTKAIDHVGEYSLKGFSHGDCNLCLHDGKLYSFDEIAFDKEFKPALNEHNRKCEELAKKAAPNTNNEVLDTSKKSITKNTNIEFKGSDNSKEPWSFNDKLLAVIGCAGLMYLMYIQSPQCVKNLIQRVLSHVPGIGL